MQGTDHPLVLPSERSWSVPCTLALGDTISQLGNGSNNREQTLQIDGAASNTTADLAVTTGSVHGTDQRCLQYPIVYWSVVNIQNKEEEKKSPGPATVRQ